MSVEELGCWQGGFYRKLIAMLGTPTNIPKSLFIRGPASCTSVIVRFRHQTFTLAFMRKANALALEDETKFCY